MLFSRHLCSQVPSFLPAGISQNQLYESLQSADFLHFFASSRMHLCSQVPSSLPTGISQNQLYGSLQSSKFLHFLAGAVTSSYGRTANFSSTHPSSYGFTAHLSTHWLSRQSPHPLLALQSAEVSQRSLQTDFSILSMAVMHSRKLSATIHLCWQVILPPKPSPRQSPQLSAQSEDSLQTESHNPLPPVALEVANNRPRVMPANMIFFCILIFI